jgi:hypothetical protein
VFAVVRRDKNVVQRCMSAVACCTPYSVQLFAITSMAFVWQMFGTFYNFCMIKHDPVLWLLSQSLPPL